MIGHFICRFLMDSISCPYPEASAPITRDSYLGQSYFGVPFGAYCCVVTLAGVVL
jgi:hypothetical protein